MFLVLIGISKASIGTFPEPVDLNPEFLHIIPELGHFLHGWLNPETAGAITFTEAEVEEGAPLSEPAMPVHVKELAHPRVALGAHVGPAGEDVASHDGVGLVA
jgi:hypothetical protein